MNSPGHYALPMAGRPPSDPERTLLFDELLARKYTENQLNPFWLSHFAIATLLLTLIIGLPTFAISGFVTGWSTRFPLAVVAGLTCAVMAVGSLMRRIGFPDLHSHVPDPPIQHGLYPLFIIPFPVLVGYVVTKLIPGATIDGFSAVFAVMIAAMAGLVLVTVESALEAALVCIFMLVGRSLFIAAAGQYHDLPSGVARNLLLAVLLAVLLLICFMVPQRILPAVSAITLGFAGYIVVDQEWGYGISYRSATIWVVLVTLVAFRILFSLTQGPCQWQKFVLFIWWMFFELSILFRDHLHFLFQ